MTKDDLTRLAAALMEQDGQNILPADAALCPQMAGIPLYATPILGFGAARDPLFAELKKPEAVGPHFREPTQWLPTAQSVICLFFPMSAQVRADNQKRMDWPGFGWIHARAEGMDMIDWVNAGLRARLELLGYQAVSPAHTAQYQTVENAQRPEYTSNWSERHAAYVCGLGTFGLSRGLITKKGVAGRLTSLITDLPLEADAREYSGLYDYCSFCGVCAKRCPVNAISLESGKDHVPCAAFLDRVIADTPQRPNARNRRYGCGKCQVKVPCEARAMPRKPQEQRTTKEKGASQ